MVSEETKLVISRAKQLYELRLKSDLEANYPDAFVTIEPDSGDFFVAQSFDAAVKLARAKHPSRFSHTIHVGHAAAFHMGEVKTVTLA
jgi:hypothetical protein